MIQSKWSPIEYIKPLRKLRVEQLSLFKGIWIGRVFWSWENTICFGFSRAFDEKCQKFSNFEGVLKREIGTILKLEITVVQILRLHSSLYLKN